MKKYHLRRKEKTIVDPEKIETIIRSGKYISISFSRKDEPYIATLNYGYDKTNNALYFHAATKGMKLDYIRKNTKVCGIIIEDHGYKDGKCDHAYRSLVIRGKIVIVNSLEEKIHGLEVLIDHLEPNPEAVRENLLKDRNIETGVCILRLDIEDITGKENF